MPSYVNTWFGLQGKGSNIAKDAVLKITDAADPNDPTSSEIMIDLLNPDGGWSLEGPDGWDMKSSTQTPTFVKNTTAHGSRLKHARFNNVVETMRLALWHFGANSLIYEVDRLEELLTVRAVRYWTDPQYNKPVYMIRKLNGEANESYFTIYYGRVNKPPSTSDVTTLNSGVLRPLSLIVERMPFYLGAVPGQVQGDVTMKAQQVWNYDLDWTTSPSTDLDQNYAIVEADDGSIYMAAASGILKWTGATWAAETLTAGYATHTNELAVGTDGNTAEEYKSGVNAGDVNITSSDLELGNEDDPQLVGIRFPSVLIPQGSTITNAYITFTADEADSDSVTLSIYGEDIDDSPLFTTASTNVSSRTSTTATVSWASPASWTVGQEYQTPDISTVIEEIVGRVGWASGNALSILVDHVSGSGRRVAESLDVAGLEPVLTIEYIPAPFTSAHKLDNGEILFGGFGGITKLSTAGVYSNETSLPTGQVRAIWEAASGFVYAADDARIIKRDETDTWAEDDDLPITNVEALFETSNKRMLAGETGRILRTVDRIEQNPYERQITTVDGSTGEQYGTEIYIDGIEGDMDFWNLNRIFLRFANFEVPNGAVINKAYILFTAFRNRAGATPTLEIRTEAADDSAVLTGVDNEISDKSLSTTKVDWATSERWRKNLTYQTPDLSAIVQETVNRAGWVSGNDIGFIFTDATLTASVTNALCWFRREAYGPAQNPGKAPLLYIEYSVTPAAGETWEVISTLPSGTGPIKQFFEIQEQERIVALGYQEMLASHDDGQTWEVLHDSSTFPNQLCAIGEDQNGLLYAGDSSGVIYRSTDRASGWEVDNNTIGSNIGAIYGESDGDVWAGDDSQVLTLAVSTPLNLGIADTTLDRVFVANHHKEANLTHAYTHVGGLFTRIFPQTVWPFDLLPSGWAANDALYFGIDTSMADSGPFNSLLFNIGTVLAVSGGSITLDWEYYNGSWSSLSVFDETQGFTQTGYKLVSWHTPSDWTTTGVNGVTGYWVRLNCSAKSGTLTSPTQESINIFSIVTPYLELDRNQAEGTFSSLMKLQLNNRSSEIDPGGSGVALYAQRVLMGVKPIDGHENFRAFLNFADEQNPTGVTVASEHGSATLVNDLSTATGRAVFIDASSVTLNTMADRASITIDTNTARDYYGKYRVFLRGEQSGGSAGEVTVQLKVVSGSGGVNFLSDRQVWRFQDDHLLVEFDEIVSLPVSSSFLPTDIGDETKIIVRTEHEQSDADLTLYDIFLLPVNTSFVDTKDLANSNQSAIGPDSRLLIDSISTPKVDLRTLVQKRSSNLIKATYLADSGGNEGGEFQIPKAQAVRIWTLTARHAGAVGTTTWVSEPEVTHSSRAFKVDRSLFGRGLR